MGNETKKSVHSGHRKRVKEKVADSGFSYLEDHQLLELLLFYSIPQADTNALAHDILNEFNGSFDEMLKSDLSRLTKIKGVGENTAMLIASVGELHRRASKVKLSKKPVYKNKEDIKNLAVSVLSAEAVEKVFVICFDSALHLKKIVEVSQGDDSSATINVRKIVQAVIDCDAKKAVLIHNHPVGASEPSAADIDATRSVCVLFRNLGLYLIDHIIVGEDNSAYSMYSDPMFTQLFY